MGGIPLPALDIRPPAQPDPMKSVGELISMKSLLNQQAIQQQEIQKNQLALDDQKNLREAQKGVDWTQPDAFTHFLNNAQQRNVSPQTLSSLSLQRAQYQEQIAKTDTATLAAEKERANQLLGHVDAIKGITDPVKRQQQAQSQASQILSGGLVKDPQMTQKIQAMASGQWVPSDEELSIFENGLVDHNTQIEQQLKVAQTEEATNKGREAKAGAVQKETETAAFQGLGLVPGATPEANSLMDYMRKPQAAGELPHTPSNYPAWKAKQEAIQTAPEKEAVAAAEGVARANVEHQIAVGGQAALANVPTHMVSQATEGAIKAGTEYAQAKSVTDRLQAMMDAAHAGNVVSYQLIPEEGALQVVTNQGIKRINMAEIQNYGGGSAWQRLQGHIGKALTGQSLPDSVLSDMADIQQIMAEGAKTKYENTLKVVNQATGATFKPVEMDTMKTQPRVTPSGKTVSLAAARNLPQNKGKSDEEIKADIAKYGHTVVP